MNDNEKRDSLLEDLNARLQKEDFDVAFEAVAILYTAYMVKGREIDREGTDIFTATVEQVIKEESEQ